MNQLSTAEFGAAKVRHKFDRACRIMSRWSDIREFKIYDAAGSTTRSEFQLKNER